MIIERSGNFIEGMNDGRRVRSWPGFETHAHLATGTVQQFVANLTVCNATQSSQQNDYYSITSKDNKITNKLPIDRHQHWQRSNNDRPTDIATNQHRKTEPQPTINFYLDGHAHVAPRLFNPFLLSWKRPRITKTRKIKTRQNALGDEPNAQNWKTNYRGTRRVAE